MDSNNNCYVIEVGLSKSLTFVIRSIASLNFLENSAEALVTSKRLKFPYQDRTDKNFIALLRMYFRDPKCEKPKMCLQCTFVFRRKLSLGSRDGIHVFPKPFNSLQLQVTHVNDCKLRQRCLLNQCTITIKW